MQYKPSHYIYVFWAGLGFLSLAISLVLLGKVSAWWIFATWLCYIFLAVTNSIGFHRLFCHRSWNCNRLWQNVLLITGTLTCYGSSLQWTVVHSHHHQHADTPEDTHQFHDWKSIFTNNYQYDKPFSLSAKRAMVRLMKENPLHRDIHQCYWYIPISFTWFINLCFGWTGVLYLYLAPVGLTIFSAALFNHISHHEDGPVNTAWYALQSSGEWRHKAHHETPWKWDLREKWYHIDLGAWIIQLIGKKPKYVFESDNLMGNTSWIDKMEKADAEYTRLAARVLGKRFLNSPNHFVKIPNPTIDELKQDMRKTLKGDYGD